MRDLKGACKYENLSYDYFSSQVKGLQMEFEKGLKHNVSIGYIQEKLDNIARHLKDAFSRIDKKEVVAK